ncbi:hypothetical protein DCS_05288 [Drechmeria coniospora]|uniref:Uncharacterized protein n=1 Tax=Drechmeria coniospora TaxID=98403 RepID=A0A151GMD5_DRECN|nr:hypothetical protein DCS_05288 [Drechmeria coniospora]KYK58275.1 hypothetical protein DCS_05288 [Drechmeria coniospora]
MSIPASAVSVGDEWGKHCRRPPTRARPPGRGRVRRVSRQQRQPSAESSRATVLRALPAKGHHDRRRRVRSAASWKLRPSECELAVPRRGTVPERALDPASTAPHAVRHPTVRHPTVRHTVVRLEPCCRSSHGRLGTLETTLVSSLESSRVWTEAARPAVPSASSRHQVGSAASHGSRRRDEPRSVLFLKLITWK